MGIENGIISCEKVILKDLFDDHSLILRASADIFLSAEARELFELFNELYQDNSEFSDRNICIRSSRLNKNTKITNTFMENFRKETSDIPNFDTHIKDLKMMKAKDNLSTKILTEVLTEVNSKKSFNIQTFENLRDAIDKNLADLRKENTLLLSPGTIAQKYLTVLKQRNTENLSYPTGDSYLDNYVVMGDAPGTITLFYSDTGSGKSTFVLNLENKKINKKIPSVYVTLENDMIMTLDRLAAMRLNIPVKSLYPDKKADCGISDEILDMVQQEMKRLAKSETFYLVEEPNLDIKDLKSIVKEAKKKFKIEDGFNVTVDLLSMVKDFAKDITAGAIEENMNSLHEFCRTERIHMNGVVQANRAIDSEKPGNFDDLEKMRPSLSNIKNSGAWAERSRVVIGLFRKKLYATRYFADNPETIVMPDVMEAIILKQNQGPLANLKYLFDGETFLITKFKEKPTTFKSFNNTDN